MHKARPGEKNYPIADRYSALHVVVGGLMGAAEASFGTTLMASILWEAAEPSLKRTMPDLFPKSSIDSPQNKIGDTAAVLFGWWLAKRDAKQAER